MKKKFTQRLLLVFLTSFCQSILYGIIVVMFMVFIPLPSIPWPPTPWVIGVVTVLEIIIPIVSALGFCFLMHRRNFKFDLRNKISKNSIYRLTVRFLSVFCFLLIGYVMSRRVVLLNVFELLIKFGDKGLLSSILTNPGTYRIVAIFPTAFAIVEYLFVPAKSDYIAER